MKLMEKLITHLNLLLMRQTILVMLLVQSQSVTVRKYSVIFDTWEMVIYLNSRSLNINIQENFTIWLWYYHKVHEKQIDNFRA